jgi:2-(3-amino-3-carboxypropyl)histidine synthase
MTIRIDENRIDELIRDNNARRVVFNAPDGLLSRTRDLASRLEKKYSGLSTIVIADPTYGSCDTVDMDAQRLGSELAFHIGHNVTVPRFGKITYNIDATDDISFDQVTGKAIVEFHKLGFKRIGLATYAQHINELPKVASILEKSGLEPVIGKGAGQLHSGQIFGCEFYPAYNVRNQVDVMAMLGQSMFHALGLCLSSGKPVFMLDPYMDSVTNVQQLADERFKKAVLSIYQALDAENFGVIIGLKEGQIMTDQSIQIKRKLESFGKKVQLIALREVTSDRLEALPEIQAFVQTGCPRLSVDGYTFRKPVLSVPQADQLINLLSGGEFSNDFFVRNHWL